MTPTPAVIAALATLLAGALIPLWQSAPWPFVAGPALAAGAPLMFVLGHLKSPSLDHHPVLVSGLSGLGCVTVMIGSQRFGEEHMWTLYPALAALLVWMLWQRRQRRPSD